MTDYTLHFKVASAQNAVVETIVRREQKPPSRSIQLKAIRLVAQPGISHRPAMVYRVPSESEEGKFHMVALYTAVKAHVLTRHVTKTIVAGDCSCDARSRLEDVPANQAPAPCAHIITALTLAELDGYRLVG